MPRDNLDPVFYQSHIWNEVELVVDSTAWKALAFGRTDRTTRLLGQGTLNWEYE